MPLVLALDCSLLGSEFVNLGYPELACEQSTLRQPPEVGDYRNKDCHLLRGCFQAHQISDRWWRN